MNKKPYIHKRIIAYIIDIFIVAMISSILILPFNKNDQYDLKLNELKEVTDKYSKKEISEEEYLSKFNDVNYDLTKININQTIAVAVVCLVYFVGFNYYKNGQTFGKKLMKLRIVSKDESKLSINQLFIRTLVGGTVLSNATTAILMFTLSKENYLIYESKLSSVFGFIYILCFAFMLYRSDGKGLHDLLASTLVVNDNELGKDDIKEAVIVETKEDKKINKKDSKKNKEVK